MNFIFVVMNVLFIDDSYDIILDLPPSMLDYAFRFKIKQMRNYSQFRTIKESNELPVLVWPT